MPKDEKEKLVPNLRFKGFTDDWIQEKLEKKADFSKGKGYKKSDLVSKGHPILLYGEMYTNYRESISTGITFVADDQNSVKSNGEEVVVPSSGESAIDIARASSIKMPNLILGGDLNIIYPDESIDNDFLALSLSNGTVKRELSKKAQGTSITHLYNSDLKNVVFHYPVLDEQLKVTEVIKTISKIITLEQEKFKQFKLVYHALIQKLLISDSSTGPEIRIENHHQNWVLQKVSDIFKITRGNVLAKSKVMSRKDDENIYPVFSSQTMDNGLMGYFNKYLFENAITWTTDGANAGTVTYRRDKFYSTNVNGVLLSEEGYASEVVALILNNTAYKYVSYVGNPKLMNNVMADIKIYLPTDMVELDKLNLLFVQSKNILHKMEQSILRYKNIKKILLRNLFV